MLGGMLLIIPGFISDAVALLLLFPPTRTLIGKVLERSLSRHLPAQGDPGSLGDIFQQARENIPADAARVNAIFDSHDVLMTPVMGGTALPIRRWEGRGALRTVLGMGRFYPYTIPWNHIGNPAMAVPAGFAADGMPLSVQIVGRPGDEATLLSLAAQIEAERPWAGQRPPVS